ncbi:MAG: hypothetical protein WCE38_02105 [Burkholderiales bacterium]
MGVVISHALNASAASAAANNIEYFMMIPLDGWYELRASLRTVIQQSKVRAMSDRFRALARITLSEVNASVRQVA